MVRKRQSTVFRFAFRKAEQLLQVQGASELASKLALFRSHNAGILVYGSNRATARAWVPGCVLSRCAVSVSLTACVTHEPPDRAKFGIVLLVFGCIGTDFCKDIFRLQHF